MSTLDLSTALTAGSSYFRITSRQHFTAHAPDHLRIVNGQGALPNDVGATYNGLRAPSSRCTKGGAIVVLFQDQSGNVRNITPQQIEFRLIQTSGAPFRNQGFDMLDFSAGEVRIPGATTYPFGAYANWTK